jgi:hypothetical protein
MKVKDLFESDNPEYQDVIDKLTELIKSNCPNNFKSVMTGKAPVLFRGDRPAIARRIFTHDGESFAFFAYEKKAKARNSLTMNSFVNSYIASSPAWRECPNRQFSTFCSTAFSAAGYFGRNVYLIIPFDNVRTFASVGCDWNDIEINNKLELSDLGTAIGILIDDLREILADLYYEDDIMAALPANIVRILKDEILHKDLSENFSKAETEKLLTYFNIGYNFFSTAKIKIQDANASIKKFIKDYKNTFGDEDAFTFLTRELTPQKMHVELYQGLSNLEPHDTDSPEIWFEGQYLAICSAPSDQTYKIITSKFLQDLARTI